MSTEKGKKRIKNQGILHDEVKSRHHIFVTPTTWLKLKECSTKKGVSISEFIELWARNIDGC